MKSTRAGLLVDTLDLRDRARARRDLLLERAGGQVVEVQVAPVVALRLPNHLVGRPQHAPARGRLEVGLRCLLEHGPHRPGGDSTQSDNLLQAVGDAYKNALDESSGIPLFGVFLGAIILAIGAFVLWLEMIIRDAAIYICVFFLPLTFVAMIWPATSRWARRLVELLVAIILAKFVIVAILSLATAAIANTNAVGGDGNTFEQMIAGAALLVLAAWSPFALLRMIPMMEGRRSERRRPALVHVGGCRIGRHPQPRRLHATGDGSELTAVDLARLRDHRWNDVRARTNDRADRRADGERRIGGRTRRHG